MFGKKFLVGYNTALGRIPALYAWHGFARAEGGEGAIQARLEDYTGACSRQIAVVVCILGR